MNFTELNLDERLQKGINLAGYICCTPVQQQVLTIGLDGVDLYVQSQTGTGKTAAYLISIFQQLLTNPQMNTKKALIMVPTRELAVQVEEEGKLLGKFTDLQCASFYGGVGYEKQQKDLKKGVSIIIGTPGRLIDLQKSGTLVLSQVGFLVVDEADRMFDMGFYPDLRTLITVLPAAKDRQTMLFSATLNTYIKNLAWEYSENAQEITIEAKNITVTEIDQMLLHVASNEKMMLLLGILHNEKPASVIIFCNTKKMCEIIAKRLQINGFTSEFIVGDLPQVKRLQIINAFKNASLTCLVATDVASRGIDVDDLAMVINFDLPNEAENYVHRIGRTARAGKTGKAYTFCSEQDVYNLPAVEKYIEMQIPSALADETMLQPDKSSGVYIPLFRREGQNDLPYKKRGDKRNQFAPDKQTDRKKQCAQKEKKSFASPTKNPVAAKPSKPIADTLAYLSLEERMKVYKEKYADSRSQNKTVSDSQPKKRKKPYAPKKNTIAQLNVPDQSSKPLVVAKKSVLSKLFSFFSAKK